ncbi:iron chelate uptake ABC transporter family permease subunit, partial [Rhizobium sp. TRM95111]|uniref:iron chelate uptake ABC transporter family permease subunit n=1 Tax=Rhizobium alarense TaxID=2846851 RepID=UPI001F48FFB5
AGARTLPQRLAWSPLIAGSQLWLVDQIVQLNSGGAMIPAGTVTALVGTPLLFAFLMRLRTLPVSGNEPPLMSAGTRGAAAVALLALAVAASATLSFLLARGPLGWTLVNAAQLADLSSLRIPRIVVALCAGMMLGICGTLLQRMTTNSMAAPEVLGVSGGASLGVLVVFVATTAVDRVAFALAAMLGAFISLALVLFVAGKKRLSPEKLLLAGASMTTLAAALAALVLATGDPRTDFLLAWLSGSTYTANASQAWAAAAGLACLAVLAPLSLRWLAVLPLGETVSRALGIGLVAARSSILVLVAIPTALATLMVGPLSFVGLMAPHFARLTGFRRPATELCAAALYGGLILVVADWLGRTLIFPWQVPAGLLTALA